MFTIRNGKFNIPKYEGFVGFAGDNLSNTTEYFERCKARGHISLSKSKLPCVGGLYYGS